MFQLGSSSGLFNKHTKVYPPGMRAGRPLRRGLNSSWHHLFISFCLFPVPYANWDSQEGCLFHLKLSVQFVEFLLYHFHGLFPFFVFSVQFCSAQSRPPLCIPMDCSTPGFPVHHQLPEPTQTHVHCVSDAIQPSHLLSSLSPPAFNLSQHQGLFK